MSALSSSEVRDLFGTGTERRAPRAASVAKEMSASRPEDLDEVVLSARAGRQLHIDLLSSDGGDTNKECKELATKYGSNILRGMKELFEISLG